MQSMPDVSPTKWHRAHTTWFFETFVLGPHAPATEPLDPPYGFLFNSYYEAVGAAAPAARARAAHPTRRRRGRAPTARHVDDAMRRRCSRGDVRRRVDRRSSSSACTTSSSTRSCCSWTSSTCCRCNPLRPSYARADRGRRPTPPATGADGSTHDGGLVEVGHDGDGFAFDNEGPRHRVLLEPFAHRRPARHRAASGWRSSPTAATAARAVAVRRLGHGAARGLGGAALLGARRRRLVGVHARRAAAGRPGRAGRATSATTRPTPSPAGPAPGCRPRRSGRPWPRRRRGRRGHRPIGRAASHARRRPPGRRAAVRRRVGVDRVAPTCPIPASSPPPARSASTTASSW